MQIATKIPVFVLTEKGMEFVANYSTKKIKKYLRERKGPYLISGYHGYTREPEKIRMGDFDTYIGMVDELPLRVKDEPKPLLASC